MRRTLVFFLTFCSLAFAQESGTVNPALWSGMQYRLIGPFRGGRVTTVTGVPSQPRTFYMGSTGGGVWKTTDAGNTWNNVSDGFFAVASMGAVEVSLSNPNVVYAGTGSSKIRSNVSIGRGIYKSTDAGKTWTFAGLRDVGQISTIRADPANPDLVYVAALGNPFADNPDRGVYRSADGGATWKKVLYLSDSAGAADLELQPGSPKTIFATMWHGQRKPWTIISGAKEGGIYKSTDGGDTWAKLAGGLPNDIFGRANVAFSAAKPNRVYALIEAKPGSGLYRSEDSGATWTLINGAGNLITRPFYYDTLGVDPVNPDVVWVGNEGWFKSTDGGRTFRSSPVPHGDNHDVWMNPKNPDIMIQSNDGGANVSQDGGRTWTVQSNQPTAEIYQVAVDNQFPYRVYGAQQDDDTVIIPSLPLGNGVDFRAGPGCETGPIIPDISNPEIVYGGCKGQFSRFNLTTTNEQKYWIGAESLYGNGGKTLIYRFQRVSPMDVSPFNSKVVYYGSQYLHRTTDGGVTWTTISPDLTAFPPNGQEASGEPITRDATGEETYSTLYSIRESSKQKGLIWTGSNDGLIFVTRDDGKTWTNVTPKDLPPGGRVQNIEPSPHRPGTAYAAIYRYLLGDFQPYLYRTDDFGKSWTKLVNGFGKDEPIRVVREDPDRAKLLYAGSEFGIYVSFNDGANWQPFQLNLPVTPITDIKLTHKDLVLSTQGRSDWILDNLTPLHQIDAKLATASAQFYKPREAYRIPGRQTGANRALQYPASGAQIDYYLASAPAGDVTLEILDAAGKTVRTFSSAFGTERVAGGGEAIVDEEGGFRAPPLPTKLARTAGMHRFVWDLKYPGPWVNAQRPEGPNGPVAVPGAYSVRFTSGDYTAAQPLTIIEDPRVTRDGVTTAHLREQFEHNIKARDLVSKVNKAVARLRDAQKTKKDPDTLTKLDKLAARMITPTIRYSKPEIQTHIQYLYGMTNSADQKIGKDAVERYEVLRKELDRDITDLIELIGPEPR
jgi:photosystem II stability/assembly factor-like uncharacterized protein